MPRVLISILSLTILVVAQSADAQRIDAKLFSANVRTTDPLTPAQERDTFILPPGFDIELVTSEPTIAKPMNMNFDARGRLWVTSSSEYPFPASPNKTPADTIHVFTDTDGDGRMDQAQTFADGLNIPIGLYPHRDGVICFSIPNIWLLRDTDDNGEADEREVLYGPFDTTRDTHGMCNSFTRGLDGWLYACHGFNNQSRVAGTDGRFIQMHSGNVFRMRTDGSSLDHFAHGQVNPFGLTIDGNGDILTADCHTKPINLVLQGGYHDSFGAPHDGLGYVPNVMEHLHGSTGIGGIALGADTNFPADYQDCTFGGNVVTSRVNRDTLQRVGASIIARAAPDFVVSSDPWFRPVNLQVAPDGSLYIADFYNRIIGHYEVPLNHPGRDRHRGRIWRVVYRGEEARRGESKHAASEKPPGTDLTQRNLEQLIARLQSARPTETRRVIDHIAERFTADVPRWSSTLRQSTITAAGADAAQTAAALWLLHRVNQLKSDDIQRCAQHPSEMVRRHALRVLRESPVAAEIAVQLITTALHDSDALVRRFAAMAACQYHAESLLRPLLDCHAHTPRSDVHLRHALRMAIGRHLKNESWFTGLVASDIGNSKAELIAELSLHVKSKAIAEYLVRYIEQHPDIPRSKLTAYLQFAVQHVSDDSVKLLARVTRRRFDNDVPFQLSQLAAIRNGLGSGEQPAAIRQWAMDLTSRLLHMDAGESAKTLAWTFIPHNSDQAVFVMTTRRKSADGRQQTPLWSSFPRGESKIGTYRSATFSLTDRFSFYLAGHDGSPDKPPQKNNVVRLRSAKSHDVRQQAWPPRNDIAQRIEWDTSPWAGEAAYVEIVDNDAANAFAWLAAGRFSVSGLNPSQIPQQRRMAADLIRQFGLQEYRPALAKVIWDNTDDRETTRALAATFAALAGDVRLQALAEIQTVAGASRQTRHAALTAIIDNNPIHAEDLLSEGLQAANITDQLRIADRLASHADGAKLLLALLESGRASPRLLSLSGIKQRIVASLGNSVRDRVATMVATQPRVDAALQKIIAERKQEYLVHGGSVVNGAPLFKKHCAACHQVAGQGARYAPNLDGIGSRGLDRLLEDTLAPSRNVDVAFRSTTIVTVDGQSLSGLTKPAENGQTQLINAKGESILLPNSEIEERIPSLISPMPANLAETLTTQQYFDLMAYLLSLTNS